MRIRVGSAVVRIEVCVSKLRAYREPMSKDGEHVLVFENGRVLRLEVLLHCWTGIDSIDAARVETVMEV